MNILMLMKYAMQLINHVFFASVLRHGWYQRLYKFSVYSDNVIKIMTILCDIIKCGSDVTKSRICLRKKFW